MELTCRFVKGIPIITLSGRLTRHEVKKVQRQLNEFIEKKSISLILDLTTLNFIDTRGLSMLVSILKKAQYYNGDVVLLHLTPQVRTLIEMINLQEIFSIYADESAALLHCSQLLLSNE